MTRAAIKKTHQFLMVTNSLDAVLANPKLKAAALAVKAHRAGKKKAQAKSKARAARAERFA